MAYPVFQVQQRFKEFWQTLLTIDFKSPQTWFDFAGWFVSVLLICLPIGNNLIGLWIILHIIFWYRLNRYILNRINPPIELLILTTLVFYVIDFLLLSSNLTSDPNTVSFNFFTGALHKFFLVFQFLFFGLILIKNNKGKQSVVIIYLFFGLFILQLLALTNIYYIYIVEFFIFFSLLKRTVWLESLTKAELWTYFFVFLILCYELYDISFLKNLATDQTNPDISYVFMPYYFLLLLKIFFLAMLVKIPIVLIFNFAGLSRKLKISSLFQSTFPQFFQLIMLLFIFHSFISGWQSESLRKTFYAELSRIKSGQADSDLTVLKKFYDGSSAVLTFENYQSFEFLRGYPELGIVKMARLNEDQKQDLFLYSKSAKTLVHDLYFVRLDPVFVKRLSENLNVILSSGLITYPFKTFSWQELIYKFDFFQDEKGVRIYPFGLVSNSKNWAHLSTILRDQDLEKKVQVNVREGFFKTHKYGVGRMILPIINEDENSNSHYAFDIYYDFRAITFDSSITSLLVMSIILFLILNSFIIKRVTGFGTEINRIIVRKFDDLKKGIREISSGNLSYKIRLEGEDEFVELADRFNKMGVRLEQTIEEAREKDILDHELKLARSVQLSLLATELPEIPGYKVAASLTTANMVGGDFYDLIRLDRDKFLFTIGDVSGKGTSAAFYMAQFLSLLRFTPQFTTQPVDILVRMNDYFSTHVRDRQIFVTAIVGILDIKNHSVQFVRAGHTLPVFISGDRRKKIHEISLTGLGIGLIRSKAFFKSSLEIKKLKLQPSDILVFNSDGVGEAAVPEDDEKNANNMKFYGEQRFFDLLNINRDKQPEQILTALGRDLDEFYGDYPRMDDFTFFILQRT